MQTEIEIDTNKERLDIDFIHGFITNSYWAKGRTISTMKICIDNSLNFGIYLKKTNWIWPFGDRLWAICLYNGHLY